jgi:hypothetical protein
MCFVVPFAVGDGAVFSFRVQHCTEETKSASTCCEGDLSGQPECCLAQAGNEGP